MEHDMDKAKKHEAIVMGIWANIRLEINLYKSELFCFGDAQDHIDQYTTLSNSKLGDFPIWNLVFLSILGKW